MITDPYLLVLNIPLHEHAGKWWADPLWRKDLEAHLAEIASLSIACPVEAGPPPEGWEPLARSDIRVHPLPPMRKGSLLAAPFLAAKLWRAVSGAKVVHTGVAGWPFPLGWLAIPIARLRRRFTVVVVESAFWRVPPGAAASRLARAKAAVFEAVNRALVRRCDATFFTTEAYRDSLDTRTDGTAHILPAVWVDEAQLIAPDRLDEIAPAKGARLLFAGRLTAQKGVDLLLRAAVRSGVAVDFVGEGELRGEVLAAERERPDLVRLLDPVGYGDAFSALLDGYAALVVPTISDEQPRVVFDAFARGLPVVASATTGNRQLVDDGVNGLLFAPGDAAALADALAAAARDPARLREMGRRARAGMTARTHAAMHADRARRIAQALSSGRTA